MAEYHAAQAASLLINLSTLDLTNPLAIVNTRKCKRYASPLQKIAQGTGREAVQQMEITLPHMIGPWEARLEQGEDTKADSVAKLAESMNNITIMASSPVKHGLVRAGAATYNSEGAAEGEMVTSHGKVIGTRDRHNP